MNELKDDKPMDVVKISSREVNFSPIVLPSPNPCRVDKIKLLKVGC